MNGERGSPLRPPGAGESVVAGLPEGFARAPAPWIAARAAATPQREALLWRDGALRYGELASRAQQAALGLRAHGVRRGDVVGLLAAGGAAPAVLVHALSLCGATLLALNVRLRERELAFQIADAGAAFLLFAPGERPRAEALLRGRPGAAGLAFLCDDALQVRVVPASAGAPPQPCDAPLCERLDARHPLALLYTSGTTGRPRAAALDVGNFLHAAQASALHLGVAPTDRWLACMPLFHVGGLSILFRSVLAGTSVLVHERFDAAAVAAELDADRVTLASFVPTMLERVLEARSGRASPGRLRAVLLGGAAASPSLLERARERGYPLAPTYGLTEACSQVATRTPDEGRPPLDGRLRPLPGVELRIVDARGMPLPAGSEGEIAVRGPSVMRGYWRDRAASRAVLRDGWLFTGDIGRLDPEGALQVLDRRSDLVVSGGENVYPAEVEAVLREHPALADAAVVGVPDATFGARPFAFVVGVRGAARPDAAALSRHCAQRLARYKVPVGFAWREALPRTASGKLQRGRLRAEVGGAG